MLAAGTKALPSIHARFGAQRLPKRRIAALWWDRLRPEAADGANSVDVTGPSRSPARDVVSPLDVLTRAVTVQRVEDAPCCRAGRGLRQA